MDIIGIHWMYFVEVEESALGLILLNFQLRHATVHSRLLSDIVMKLSHRTKNRLQPNEFSYTYGLET